MAGVTPEAGEALTERVRRFGRLARKELREILRDRRTIITLVLMPLLLYPILGFAFRIFFLGHIVSHRAPEFMIVCRSAAEADLLMHFLKYGHAGPDGQSDRDADGQPLATLHFAVAGSDEDLRSAVNTLVAHVGLHIPDAEKFRIDPGRELAVNGELLYAEHSALSHEAVRYIQSRLATASAAFLSLRLRKAGIDQRPMPLKLTLQSVTDPAQKDILAVAVLVPLVLILMTITGAVYPAIDLTAGERERGTLELLMAAPIPRLQLLLAKYIAVLAVAVLTALVNLVMMTATAQLSGLGTVLFGEHGLSAKLFIEVFALLLLFVFFFAAVLLSLTSFARSFKEAQAYLVPLMLVSLAPGIIGVVPGLSLMGPLAVVPLLNIVLAGRDLFLGQLQAIPALIVVASTLVYAFCALALASTIFGAEAVLYRERALTGRWFGRG